MQELVLANPDTVVVWQHHLQSTVGCTVFHHVFWAFGLVIEAFRHLKPVICVDGTFMKGTYKSKLLVAVGFDASNVNFRLLSHLLMRRPIGVGLGLCPNYATTCVEKLKIYASFQIATGG